MKLLKGFLWIKPCVLGTLLLACAFPVGASADMAGAGGDDLLLPRSFFEEAFERNLSGETLDQSEFFAQDDAVRSGRGNRSRYVKPGRRAGGVAGEVQESGGASDSFGDFFSGYGSGSGRKKSSITTGYPVMVSDEVEIVDTTPVPDSGESIDSGASGSGLSPVPVPSALLLLASGLAAVGGRRWTVRRNTVGSRQP